MQNIGIPHRSCTQSHLASFPPAVTNSGGGHIQKGYLLEQRAERQPSRTRLGDNMQVGDLVKARHWGSGYIGIVISIRPKPSKICRVMINGGHCCDQLMSDLEVINAGR